MGRGLFITGTDTGVGKTFVTAGMLRALNGTGYRSCPMKPVETGCKTKGGILIPADARKLLSASGLDESLDAVNPYRFRHALSPSAAAEEDGSVISKSKIIAGYNRLRNKYDLTIVEGAGGLMVPLYKKYLFMDLIKEMEIPLIIVARPWLGTVNHTLLTLRAARDAGINVIGVIINHASKTVKDVSARSNPAAIKSIGNVDILGEVPFTSKPGSVLMGDKFTGIVNNIFSNRNFSKG